MKGINKKKIFIILVIYGVVLSIFASGTFAYLRWVTGNKNKTVVEFTLNRDFSCSADTEGDVSPSNVPLAPATCTDPVHAIKRELIVQTEVFGELPVHMDLWMDVKSISSELSATPNLKYAITTDPNSCTNGVLISGNLQNKQQNDVIEIFNKRMYTTSRTDTYYLYVWLDAAETNPNTMNKSFNLSINGNCENTELQQNTLANYITNLYNADTLATVTQNNVIYYRNTTNLIMNDGFGLGNESKATEGNLRYYGANPNNYIKFNCDIYPSTNCETWRIIGVFTVDGTRKVKLIRDGHIGEYSWDTRSDPDDSDAWHGFNDWSEATLMKLLNGGYTGAGGSLYYNAESGKCLGNQGATQYNCNFTSTGLKNATTRNAIDITTHYLGGFDIDGSDFYHYVNEFYIRERSNNVYSGNPTTWSGQVALAYPSDYGYGADLSSCNYYLGNYDLCKNNNWMFRILGKDEAVYHLLTPNNDENWHVAYVQADGKMGSGSSTYFNQRVVPTVYLDAMIEREGGSGTSSDPYTLKLE